MSESHEDLAIRQTAVAGAAAGDVAVTDIKTEDVLKSVLHVDFTTPQVEDLTDEFSIASDGTINNDGGTDTSGEFLIVTYIAADPRGGDLNRD